MRATKKYLILIFFVDVTEALIDVGKGGVPKKRKRRVGRHLLTSVLMQNVGNHMPIKEKTRRRCIKCKCMKKKEKRASYFCQRCNVSLCMDCFTPYHTLI